MDFRLEVVVIPVADVDRAKAFYQWFAQETTTRVPGR